MTSSDSFCAAFDAIELENAPSPAAIDAALSMCVRANTPGFYLLDDAGGRFVVDHEWGLISLRNEALLDAERGQIHAVRLEVIEPSGARYEAPLRLRLSGGVPQVVSEESPAIARDPAPLASDPPARAWRDFTATLPRRAEASGLSENAPFGAIAPSALPQNAIEHGDLGLAEILPPPGPACAHWAI